MKIQSKFKDYYDYVEYLYSQEGGDPSNTYVRKELSQPDQPDSSNVYVTVNETDNIPDVPRQRNYEEILPWAFKWCSVCGELYLLVSKICLTPEWRLVTEDHPSLSQVYSGHSSRWFEEVKMGEIIGVPNKSCVSVSKQLHAPVFIIETIQSQPWLRGLRGLKKSPQVAVSREIPNLGKLGFASVTPAEQMYQNISMFMASLRDSPDSIPPVNVSDKDRLVQKGFDAKISFRGKFPPCLTPPPPDERL